MEVFMGSREEILTEDRQGEERRCVSLITGPSLSLLEQSSGPVTWKAYGSRRHGHKMLGSPSAWAQALGVAEADVTDAIKKLFDENKNLVLSDFMDRFDGAGERYTYIAWNGMGDIVLRN